MDTLEKVDLVEDEVMRNKVKTKEVINETYSATIANAMGM